MEDFKNDTERMETLKRIFSDVYQRYPEYVTQQQAAEICEVDVQTIRKWEKSGDLPYVTVIDHLVHYHQIKLDTLLTCLYIKNCLHDGDSPFIVKLRQYYTKKLLKYADGLLIREVSTITGYGKTAVVNWMNRGRLKGHNRGRIYRIPKKYLIDFLCGPYYRQIVRKSKIHRADMQSFLEQ